MTESTPAPPRNFTVFGVIAEAWHLTKGAKWAILAPLLAGMLLILAIIAGAFGLILIVTSVHFSFSSLLIAGVIIAIITRVISIYTSKKFSSAALVAAIILYLFLFSSDVVSTFIYTLISYLINLAVLAIALYVMYVLFGLLAGIINTSIERARGHEVSSKMGFRSFPRALPVGLTFLINAIILSPPQLIEFYFFGFHDSNIGMALISLIYSVEIGSLLYLCLPLAVEKTNSPFTATLSSLKVSKNYWFKLMGIFIILYVAPYIVFLLALGVLFLSTFLISSVPSLSLHFVLFTNILTSAFAFLLFIPFIWFIPLMFLIQGVVYHKLVD